MIYAYITGGGTKWIYDSLKKGGASKWFLGARIPYNQKDFDEILDGKPFDGKYVSERTAAQLSTAAYAKAVKLTDEANDSIGLGVTAKLGTKGQRKGRENKIIISLTNSLGGYLKTYNTEHILPSWMPRRLQEWLCSCYITKFIKDHQGKKHYNSWNLPYINELDSTNNKSIVMYSGSFNPMHDGHLSVIEVTKGIFKNHEFVLEITSNNFSKGLVGPYEMVLRSNQVDDVCYKDVVFSSYSTFIEKAKVLSFLGYTSIVFPMGDDTYKRVTKEEKDELVKLGASFLVFRRENNFIINDHPVINPESFMLPRVVQISSTEIRKNAI